MQRAYPEGSAGVGTCGNETGEFLVAVGKGAHEKHRFRAGMELSGFSVPVDDPRLEVAGFYKTSRIKIDRDVDARLFYTPAVRCSKVQVSGGGH
jgi:hypothetical protein